MTNLVVMMDQVIVIRVVLPMIMIIAVMII
uniref:Uncharacterized protein n=1 Tax=viral metagenome TaxID=1070528 RepID=A0A6C0HB96_9ZZZZ